MVKYVYKVTVEVDPRDATMSEIAKMIRHDIGSWEGSVPVHAQIRISKVTVVGLKETK